MGALADILDFARWAPSGDNTQPWRFELVGPEHAVIHGFDTRDHCVYDFSGRASQVSLGALLETITIAASGSGFVVSVQRRMHLPDTRPTFDVHLQAGAGVRADPLMDSIRVRSVQRRPLSTRPLRAEQKSALEAAVGPDHSVLWLECFADRLRMARLLFANAQIRLTMPEAYPVHRDIIEWGARFSEDRIPDQALGLDPVTTRAMRWAMQSWGRVDFLNRFMAGTLAPRIQLDLIPALACAAHFVIVARDEPQAVEHFVAGGRKVQRFWLTATHHGLQLQPAYTPLVFAAYVRAGVRFSVAPALWGQAVQLTARLQETIGVEHAGRAIFMGRLGFGSAARARSLRLPLDKLLVRAG
ncbi:molybdopterin biosynthesis protein MoeY [Accumulibacter sp.]|uniref:molybdopterin biosynthesis protein MoeY n=1 Tax=Accumulibacter sp. TaxID=2053492 RepID=UPI0025F14CD8|nr:molybdopterin biosynthesis protein MoeY [Accumulibacter sp.]MCM8612266.1 molybdopterin biosynthesis protein MoeY [Accumulibacter sp.]MCM8635939.1 molybdopterin biosynthesis protein MoeY [Accumulibacter sp.]MCM8639452.1 molybdopterin biosynthesis protein MoeY [Accumulibacter sp.]